MLVQPANISSEVKSNYVYFMKSLQQTVQQKGRKLMLCIGIVVGLLIVVSEAKAQEKNIYLYGKVTTISGDKYQGALRWGGDEVFWVDLFNAEKTSSDFLKFLSKTEIEQISEQEGGNSWLGIDLGILSIWDDRYSQTKHQFDTRFGDIRSIRPTGRSKAQVTLKNGVIIEVGGNGFEDVGASVSVYDQELGVVKLDWTRIEKVEFLESAIKPKYIFGEAIYAKVSAGRRGSFEGVIQWDQGTVKNNHNERFLEDVLNGKDRDGDKNIPFKSISKIVKNRNGVEVTLKSGRQFFLTGSNDVNDENAGILVNDWEIGQVVIPWRDFEALEILEQQKNKPSFSDFSSPKGLRGTVVTVDGEKLSGLLAYDLDEAWEFETLDGQDDRVVYKIPFRNIKNIIPKNFSYSMVILKNGRELLLGESRDVSEANDGVLIFTSKDSKPTYIRWSKIDEIIFD